MKIWNLKELTILKVISEIKLFKLYKVLVFKLFVTVMSLSQLLLKTHILYGKNKYFLKLQEQFKSNNLVNGFKIYGCVIHTPSSLPLLVVKLWWILFGCDWLIHEKNLVWLTSFVKPNHRILERFDRSAACYITKKKCSCLPNLQDGHCTILLKFVKFLVHNACCWKLCH